MREKALNLLGLMRKANAVQIGETDAGSAVRAGSAKLLILASDASDNATSRAMCPKSPVRAKKKIW